MSKHARASVATHPVVRVISDALDWHRARPRASMDSVRGWVWMVLIAAVFFWMSNPLVFVPGFHLALPKAITWTTVVVIITLPWIRVPYVPWPWILFHVLAALSILWTIDPNLTDYTNVLYLKITALALIVAANCEARVVGWGMGLGGVVVTALSIYAYREQMWGASYPESLDPGATPVLAGVGTNENILAYTLAVSFAAILAVGPPRHLAARVAWLVVLGASAYGLYLAGSGTGFLTVLSILLALAVALALPALRRRRRRDVLLWVAASVTSLLAALFLVTVVLGKEFSTLSGRIPFWGATIDVTMDRSPLVGSGWGAVWLHAWSMVPPNAVLDEIIARAGYPLSHGHNFFIDVLPELGILGVAVTLSMIFYVALQVGRSGLQPGDRDPAAGRLALLVLVALLTFGVTEPLLTAPLGWWALALVAALPRQRVVLSCSQGARLTATEREADGATYVGQAPLRN